MAQNDATQESLLDGELDLKKRARRRLVGATALALLAAVVLPMVMDHEPRPSTQEIQVRIPAQEAGGFASKILPAKPAPTPLPPVVEAKPAAPEPAPEKVAEKPAPKPVEKPAPKPAEKPVEKPAAASAEDAPRATTEQWVVQLGAYKEAGNVKILVAKIKQMGLPVYTEPFNMPEGPRTRVRSGPFPSREAAERAQARIKTIGVNGPVAPKQ